MGIKPRNTNIIMEELSKNPNNEDLKKELASVINDNMKNFAKDIHDTNTDDENPSDITYFT